MKEHPILFSGAMVRAIFDGRKSQTRRVMKPQPDEDPKSGDIIMYKGSEFEVVLPISEYVPKTKCPYGKPGDRLWVRETWANLNADFPDIAPYYVYRADNLDHGPVVWKPSIHMPRAASRLLLEITELRGERLHEISEDDAKSEGVYYYGLDDPDHDDYMNYLHAGTKDDQADDWGVPTAKESFKTLWQSINGPESWQNLWVRAIEFKKI